MEVNIYIYRDTTPEGDPGIFWEADDAEGVLNEAALDEMESLDDLKNMIRDLYIEESGDDDFDDIILEIDPDLEEELPFDFEQEYEDNGWGDEDEDDLDED